MKMKKSKTPIHDFWATIELEVAPGNLWDPNKPLPPFVQKKMEAAQEALKYPGLPARAYEKDTTDQSSSTENE